MKYNKEFKMECVMKYKKGAYIEDPPGTNSHSSFRHQVVRWARIYDSLGEAGLEHGRPILDVNRRIELIERVEAGESYSSVALAAGIQANRLIKWHNIYLESGADGLKLLRRGRAPMNKKKPVMKDDSEKSREELLEELEYYKAENEYLKKLSALVQERKAQPQEKK